jgi:hypothetical protein
VVDGLPSALRRARPGTSRRSSGSRPRKVALEYEGADHFGDGQIVRDDARIERLHAAGRLVERISAADLRDLDAVVEKVQIALASP